MTPDDVREMSPYVLRHRLILDGRRSRDDVLAEALSHLPGSPAAV